MDTFPKDSKDKLKIMSFLDKLDKKFQLKNLKPVEYVLRTHYVNEFNRILKDFPDYQPITKDDDSLYHRTLGGAFFSKIIMAIE